MDAARAHPLAGAPAPGEARPHARLPAAQSTRTMSFWAQCPAAGAAGERTQLMGLRHATLSAAMQAAPGGGGYQSKLDQFDEFVARSKFAALPLVSAPVPAAAPAPAAAEPLPQLSSGGLLQASADGGQPSAATHHPASQPQPGPPGTAAAAAAAGRPPQRCKLLLIDDLPYAEGERRQRLAVAMRDLACTARCPVVIIATEQASARRSSAACMSFRGGWRGHVCADAAAVTCMCMVPPVCRCLRGGMMCA